jgi:tetratricopeptide (TPR) repeat protein
LTASTPRVEERIAFGRQCLERGAFADAVAAAREAVAAYAGVEPRLFLVEALLQAGDGTEALAELERLEWNGQDDALVLQRVAQLYTGLNHHENAARCATRSLALAPDNPAYLYNYATAMIAVGRLEEAEKSFDRVIAEAPNDYDAYYNRATLRKQTPERNHVAELERLVSRGAPKGAVALNYALAKELEDLGDDVQSFQALARGARARRAMLSYNIEDDVQTMREIASVFDAGFFAASRPGNGDTRPVFILGLPRSGTTLVDRILSSHPEVSSLGEIANFATSLMRLAGRAPSKRELIWRTRDMDFTALGSAYSRSINPLGGKCARLIDKTPVNFLYLGLIAMALPNAHIVHVRRQPMDVCYAMLKTLFRMAYPFSYNQTDLANYYAAYDRLMQHWRAVLPGRFLEVDYEDLIANQEAVSRGLVAHCGLEWDPACLSFERNTSPSLTASAAQIRQPIYASSVGLWHRYAASLEPLRMALHEAGVDPETL